MNRKRALVTGASKGIGRQIALTLAKNGYDVGVNYYSDKAGAEEVCRLISEVGTHAVALYGDVGSLADIKAMFDRFEEEFGGIDLLVNNAGISAEAPFLETDEAFFDRMNNTDWKGLYFCAQTAAKQMITQGVHGVIINIASNQIYGCWPDATVYAGVKSAVSGFTRNAALELAPYGVRMAAVAPGYTDVGWEADDHRYDAANYLPLRRFATMEEIAEAVRYLASEQAGYITGTCLTVDGGATLPVVAANEFTAQLDGLQKG